MKRNLSIGIMAGLVVVLAWSCDLLKVVDINFTTSSYTIDVVISPASAGNYVEVVNLVESNIKKEIEDHGGSINNLETITISELSVECISGVENLNPFGDAEITFGTTDDLTKKVAWVDPVPENVTSIVPAHTTDNLKDYLTDDSYNVIFQSNLRSDLTEETVLRIKLTFDVQL